MPAITYTKTAAGQDAFRARDASISARQRKAFLLFDGRRSLQEVFADTAGLGVTAEDVQDLVAKGFLQPHAVRQAAAVESTDAARIENGSTDSRMDPASTNETDPQANDPSDLYKAAYPIATRITANLGLRGFRLNLQVESASGYSDLVAMVPALVKAAGEDAVRPLKEALKL